MVRHNTPLTEQVEAEIRRATADRIRHLSVQEDRGRVLIRGQAPSHYAKQLALHGAGALLPGDCIRIEITVR